MTLTKRWKQKNCDKPRKFYTGRQVLEYYIPGYKPLPRWVVRAYEEQERERQLAKDFKEILK